MLALAEQVDATYCPITQVLQLVPAVTPWRQNWFTPHGSHRQPEGAAASVMRMKPAEQVHTDDTMVELAGQMQSAAEVAPIAV